ncbi:magnesium transporter [Haloechinothrix sp. YIM 98757]|uniref:Magnesium transporter MgtE n=1 Tax=Haloechinothrix aidingensis TaxID=2752311 RepID=A0A838ADY5_9PSEU|nr:magnesium transporter [Haloechinothrix aidingensis]MBA0127524.1 magnesium transporter [Haloechinothrix aidingensis]
MATDTLSELVEANDVPGMQQWLGEHAPYEIADELGRNDSLTAVLLFRLLDKDRAIDVFEELDPVDQQKILYGLRDKAFGELVEAMDPDDRARLLGEAPAKFAQRVLSGLSEGERAMTARLLGYDEGTVGRHMSPKAVLLRGSLTAQQALATVRAKGIDAETVYTLPVVDNSRRFQGVVALRDLVISDENTTVAELADSEVPTAKATDDSEAAARLMQEANLLDLTVVDSEDRVIGLLTIDDAVEVIEAADTEDVARQSATAPWTGHYMAVSVLQLAWSRVIWLMLLLLAASLTIGVLDFFEDELETVVQLAIFIPMLVGTGGNAGAQAATAAVRALAVGELRTGDVLRVAFRESRVGLLLGLTLAAVTFVLGMILVGDLNVGIAVSLSLVLICVWAAIIGGTMPLLAKRVGIDPAVVSAPLVTTFVDATGLVFYFLIALAVHPAL